MIEALIKHIQSNRGGSVALLGGDSGSVHVAIDNIVYACHAVRDWRKYDDDLLLIDTDDTEVGVEQVRNIHLFLKYCADRMRTVIIDSLAGLSERSINVLLKVVEEPPDNSLFLIVAPFYDDRFAVVLSRCHIVRMPHSAPSDASIEAYKAILLNSVYIPRNVDDLLRFIYMLSVRVYKYHFDIAGEELFIGEFAALLRGTAPRNNDIGDFVCAMDRLLHLISSAAKLNIGLDSLLRITYLYMSRFGWR